MKNVLLAFALTLIFSGCGVTKNIINAKGNCTPEKLSEFQSEILVTGITLEKVNKTLRKCPSFASYAIPESNDKLTMLMALTVISGDAPPLILSFLNAKPSLGDVDKFGRNALHHAVKNEKLYAIALYASSGVPINDRDQYGDSPFDIAHKAFSKDPQNTNLLIVMRLLAAYGAEFGPSGV